LIIYEKKYIFTRLVKQITDKKGRAVSMKLSKLVKKIENKGKFTIKIPIPALGCGVLGLSFAKYDINMGKYASQLLKSLEYRGYDSTGAAIQDDKGNIILKKDVGAPSELVKTLGITDLEGKIFCGQVRWATFGAVTQENAQPHVVKCKKHIYGAHNGNITNTHSLKSFLAKEGHKIASDNDGEMLVHTVEHYFDMYLEKYPDDKHKDHSIRRKAMINAILDATEKAIGSFAAVIVDPITEKSYAIKAGSSLYAGKGTIDGNDFILLSSDLTAVLKFTKDLINLREGNFIEYDSNEYQVYSYKNMKLKQKDGSVKEIKKGDKVDIPITRSKLRAEDTELHPQFHFFMHQEIFNQVESSKNLITFFNKGSKTTNDINTLLEKIKLKSHVLNISKEIYRTDLLVEQREIFSKFHSSKEFQKIAESIKKLLPTLSESVKK